MSNRPTKKIKTPIDGVEIELKEWINGYESVEIEMGILNNLKNAENIKNPLLEQNKRVIEIVVVSVNGNKENITDKIFNLKRTDYNFVIDEINKITNPLEFDDKKKD